MSQTDDSQGQLSTDKGDTKNPSSRYGGEDAPFVWHTLNDINRSLGELSGKIDGMNTRFDAVEKRFDGVNTKLEMLDTVVRYAKAVLVASVFIVGVLWALYKVFEPHLSVTLK
jgi:hypothetical protein